MKKSEFYFDLPKELIAQKPLENREQSRLMVVKKNNGEIQHDKFTNILSYLKEGDCLVLNDTRVLPARLLGIKKETGAKVEVLLLAEKALNTWEALVKPGKKIRTGDVLSFGDGMLLARPLETLENSNRIIEFYNEEQTPFVFQEILDELGEMPLPHYIKEKLTEKERYQTVYAKNIGSVAAPTAGLHFTEEILK